MPDGASGPFILHTMAIGDYGSRKPLHRCTVYGVYYIATSAHCDGFGHSEQVLGYVALRRSSEMARSLRRCRDGYSRATYRFYRSLDVACPARANQSDVLGYVFT